MRRAIALAATVWSELTTKVLASAIAVWNCAGHLLRPERDRRKLGVVVDVAREVVELVAQQIAAAHELVLRHQLAVALGLDDIGKDLGKGTEFPGKARDLIDARRVRRVLHRLVDGVFQTGFGCQRGFGVIFLAGHHIISRQRTVRDQFAVDILGQIGFRHAVSVGLDAGGNALKPHIGDAHADRRDGEHERKAEHDFSAKSQGREPSAISISARRACNNPTSTPVV